MSTGWICPKCNKVYSPDTAECYSCNSVATVSTSTSMYQCSVCGDWFMNNQAHFCRGKTWSEADVKKWESNDTITDHPSIEITYSN